METEELNRQWIKTPLDEKAYRLYRHYFEMESWAKEFGVKQSDLTTFKKLLIRHVRAAYRKAVFK